MWARFAECASLHISRVAKLILNAEVGLCGDSSVRAGSRTFAPIGRPKKSIATRAKGVRNRRSPWRPKSFILCQDWIAKPPSRRKHCFIFHLESCPLGCRQPAPEIPEPAGLSAPDGASLTGRPRLGVPDWASPTHPARNTCIRFNLQPDFDPEGPRFPKAHRAA